ncbi:MAG: tRNA guanosine(34) transglycosylase Tgt [Bacteroidota bacterium]|nr:tRNA guanosine(34) transglycosylase Tgt [Bacteroidota bacterium]
MKFDLIHSDASARAGIIHTDHGDIETPIFMPVGTQGSVKAVEQRELEELGTQIILGNTYHLYLRPGVDLLKSVKGLHRFMSWTKPILTDSGGYQVFSLSDLRKISDKGVTFKSHLDGSMHFFSPEDVINVQRAIGSDIMMVLDECTPFPCERDYAQVSNKLTVQWAQRCQKEFHSTDQLYEHTQALFGIVQGSVYKDIRKESAAALTSLGFDGYAIGGLAVGEPVEVMYEMAEFCTALLPANKPRYLMGVGTPGNLLESVERGVDMFDCVLPTRNGRNGMVFTRNGKMNFRNVQYRADESAVDEECGCYLCRNFSRAYLRHLFVAKEILALQLASLHNLTFYLWLMKEARRKILSNEFSFWKKELMMRYHNSIVTA